MSRTMKVTGTTDAGVANKGMMVLPGGAAMGGIMVELRVVSPVGMGMLAAARLAKLAGNYPCVIRIGHGSAWADARDILDLLSLGAGVRAELSIEAKGNRAHEAASTISWMVADSYGITSIRAGEGELVNRTCIPEASRSS